MTHARRPRCLRRQPRPRPRLPRVRPRGARWPPSTCASSASRRSRSATTRTSCGWSPAQSIEAGPQSIWRYAGLLPAGQDEATRVSLGAGMTPLREAKNLAAALGMRKLWVKDDSANPTHSFKDRVVSVALSAARAFGYTTVSCASTGNLANSVAAHATQAGLRSVVFIPNDLEQGKVVQTAVYGQTLVAVEGTYDDVNRLCSEIAENEDWAFVNVNVRPVLRRGQQDARLRGRRAARLAHPAAGRHPDGVRLAAHQGRQGLRRAGQARPGRRVRRGRSTARRPPAARRSPPRTRTAGTP